MPQHARPMPHSAFRILLALAGGERHGYAIMQELRTDRLGAPVGPGALYRTIQQLLDDSLIVESSGVGQPSTDERRRYFRMSAAGRRALAKETARLSELVRRAAAMGLVNPERR